VQINEIYMELTKWIPFGAIFNGISKRLC